MIQRNKRIEDLIKKRKELKVSVKMMSRVTGYSAVWLYKIEKGERRVSDTFINVYSEALELLECMQAKNLRNG